MVRVTVQSHLRTPWDREWPSMSARPMAASREWMPLPRDLFGPMTSGTRPDSSQAIAALRQHTSLPCWQPVAAFDTFAIGWTSSHSLKGVAAARCAPGAGAVWDRRERQSFQGVPATERSHSSSEQATVLTAGCDELSRLVVHQCLVLPKTVRQPVRDHGGDLAAPPVHHPPPATKT